MKVLESSPGIHDLFCRSCKAAPRRLRKEGNETTKGYRSRHHPPRKKKKRNIFHEILKKKNIFFSW